MIPGDVKGSHCGGQIFTKVYKVTIFINFFFILKNHYPRKVETSVEASTDSAD